VIATSVAPAVTRNHIEMALLPAASSISIFGHTVNSSPAARRVHIADTSGSHSLGAARAMQGIVSNVASAQIVPAFQGFGNTRAKVTAVSGSNEQQEASKNVRCRPTTAGVVAEATAVSSGMQNDKLGDAAQPVHIIADSGHGVRAASDEQ